MHSFYLWSWSGSLLTVNGFFFPTHIFSLLGVQQGSELDQGVFPEPIVIINLIYSFQYSSSCSLFDFTAFIANKTLLIKPSLKVCRVHSCVVLLRGGSVHHLSTA